uniref:AT1G17665-like protein n=1 Tax=Geranium phaeum TaxID=379952 RepID=A0A0G4ANP1_9ROSI|nr:AT1G17665-like protein [Geranium phaeum]
MWFSLIFFVSFITFSFSVVKKKSRGSKGEASSVLDGECKKNNNTHLSHSLVVEMDSDRSKKKKKRAKKKKSEDGSVVDSGCPNGNLVCLYPFTSSSSATQRKIKQQYDELVKCHDAKGLTLPQVAQFATCLIEARNELKHKSEVIQRKFTITKALFLKADRSSIDRLRQQIYKLELEEKRLEEDTFVYNWLQQQLKISPAYKKMLEICACMELKAKSGELMENQDAEGAEISFEELLAQEKKDSFWQKNGKLRSLSS